MDPENASQRPVHGAGDLHCEKQADTVPSMRALWSLGQSTGGMDRAAYTYLAAESGAHVQQPPRLLTHSSVLDQEADEIETDYSGRASSQFPSPLSPKGALFLSCKFNALPYSSNDADQLQHKVYEQWVCTNLTP